MARKAHILPDELNLKDFASASVLAIACPRLLVERVLEETGKNSIRERLLPATFVVYYILALSLWREYPLEDVYRLIINAMNMTSNSIQKSPIITKGSISNARTRLGPDVMRILADTILTPIATPDQQCAWYNNLRVMAVDGTIFDLPDTKPVANYFGYPGSSTGESAFPQARVLSLIETGTHAITGAEIGPYRTSEQKLAEILLPKKLMPDMLLLADRNFYGYHLWNICSQKCNLLWRIKSNLILPVNKRLPDGSFLSYVLDSNNRSKCQPIPVRVIEYTLKGSDEPQQIYRLITTLLNHKNAPAKELACLYHERWEIENSLNEIKGSLKGYSTQIRSKNPLLVIQELWGLILVHFSIRYSMNQAALLNPIDTDELSFKKTLTILKLNMPQLAASPPCEPNK
jgi:hypothetical protein